MSDQSEQGLTDSCNEDDVFNNVTLMMCLVVVLIQSQKENKEQHFSYLNLDWEERILTQNALDGLLKDISVGQT